MRRCIGCKNLVNNKCGLPKGTRCDGWTHRREPMRKKLTEAFVTIGLAAMLVYPLLPYVETAAKSLVGM